MFFSERWRCVCGKKTLAKFNSQTLSSVRPQSKPLVKGCCARAHLTGSLACSRDLSQNQLVPSSYLPSTFLSWNHWIFLVVLTQSELKAGDTQAVTDQHLGLAPKHIYLLSCPNILIPLSGSLPCPQATIPCDLSNWASAYLPYLILACTLIRTVPAQSA